MEYIKTNMSSYNLHTIKTNKFKTIQISVNFRRPVKKEEITIRRLLFSLLCYSNKKYNTNRLLEIKKEDLYMLGLSTDSGIIGNYINSYIDMFFLNKEYSDEFLLKDSLEFLFDILFNPDIKDGMFNEISFNNIVENIKTNISSTKDNLSSYSLLRLLEEADNNNPLSYHIKGYLDDLELIKLEDVYKYYQHVLKNDIVDIFVVGDIEHEYIKKMFEENFKIKVSNKYYQDIYYNYNIEVKNIKSIYEEVKNINQAKLSISMRTINITEKERRYILPLYTDILGGGSFSKLYQNIRETNSLCYSIYSTAKSTSSIVLISAGIDESNYEKTLSLIKKEIDDMSTNVSDDEVKRSINNSITAIKSSINTQDGIISHYFKRELFNSDSIEDKIKNINNVKKEDIINISKKIKLDTIFLLGGQNEKNRD